MPLQGSVEAVDQSNSVERLGQEGNCSGLQRSRTDSLFGEGRDEDEWHAVSMRPQEVVGWGPNGRIIVNDRNHWESGHNGLSFTTA